MVQQTIGVRSYTRSEDLRKLLTQVNVAECARVYARSLNGYRGADTYLKKQVEIIRKADAIVHRLEGKHIVTTYTPNSTLECMQVVKEFANFSLKVGQIETHLRTA